jgi:hypothetical protein
VAEDAGAPADDADPRPSTAGTGVLYLNVIPVAKVYWRGKLLGETPIEGLRLAAGDYTLLLKNDGLGLAKRLRVRVVSGQRTQHVVDLKTLP